jgi:hypothetical protein
MLSIRRWCWPRLQKILGRWTRALPLPIEVPLARLSALAQVCNSVRPRLAPSAACTGSPKSVLF